MIRPHLHLERKVNCTNCTLGVLRDDKEGNAVREIIGESGRICYTLERPWRDNRLCISHIPPGEYSVRPDRRRGSQKFRFSDLETRPRSAIEIHAGNVVEDTQGCIMVGSDVGPMTAYGKPHVAVYNSRKTLQWLREHYPTGFQLTITDPS